jgi:hypothetical protein
MPYTSPPFHCSSTSKDANRLEAKPPGSDQKSDQDCQEFSEINVYESALSVGKIYVKTLRT